MEYVPNNIDLDPEMILALQEMRKANANPMVRELIELREKAEHDEASRIQQALKTGREQGKIEGKIEGIEVGKSIALSEFTSNSTLKWYKKGIDPKEIAEILEIQLTDVLRIIDGQRIN